MSQKKKEEENVENELGDRESQGSVNIKKEEEYNFAENLMEGIKKENIDIPKIPGLYNNLGLGNDNNIISFPSFDFDKERKKNIKSENELNKLRLFRKSQKGIIFINILQIY